MTRFVLSPAAAADIEQIEAFLDAHAPHATDTVLGGIRDAMRRIAGAPGLGHLREDLTSEPVRFQPVWSYRLVYREADPVEFVRVLHASRDALAQLGGRPRKRRRPR